MRMFLVVTAALFCSGGVLPSTPGGELHGCVQVGGRHQASAVIWLDAPNAPVLAAPRKVVLDQRNLAFSPRVLAVRVGTEVEFPNNDRVFHNVFSFRDGKKFDLGMYPVGAMKRVTFDRPGLSRIFCNIHPNMAAYVFAVDSSYVTITDEHGAFRIPVPPSGTYTYHAWWPGGSILGGSISIDHDTELEIRQP